MEAAVKRIVASRRFKVWFPWISAAVLLAGIAAVLVTFFYNTAPKQQANPTGPRENLAGPPKSIPLPKEVRSTAYEFVRTAVVRKNLAKAWPISHPDIRAGSTYKQWLKGDIAVVPFFHLARVSIAKIAYSHPETAGLWMVLQPKVGKPLLFEIDLQKWGKGANRHWTVENWQPLAGPPVPAKS